MKKISNRSKLAGAAFAAALLAWSGASAQTFSEYPVPGSTGNNLGNITPGFDGALWFTEFALNQIGRISTAGVVTSYPVPTANGGPSRITTGPDGALWFSEYTAKKIGRIASDGTVTEFGPTSGNPFVLALGPDGAMWFTERGTGGNKIGRITTSGAITEFNITTTSSNPASLTDGPDGAIWFCEFATNKIGRITTAGVVTEYTIPTAGSGPASITKGPDGALWFTEQSSNKIGRLTTDGTFTNEYVVPTAGSGPDAIQLGPDGEIWFTENLAGQIGRINVSGAITEFAIPTSNSGPVGIVTGSDRALWFTENHGNQIGRLTVAPATSPLFAATLPASRSVQVGNTATAFATIINSSATAATNCGIVPVTTVPAAFSFQTTSSQTNGLTGTPNTRVAIAGNQSQSFVVAFQAAAPLSSRNVTLGYDCTGIDAVGPIVGLNTLLLTFDASPVPDVIALAATADGGTVDIPGATGAGAFAMATVNIGAPAVITVSADTGTATLSETTTICQTNPSSGQCLLPPSPTVTLAINTNDTPTFSLFVTGTGAVPFDPGNNRIFVRLKDAAGITRGSTSVAVRTQ